jgi:hypothetical protein
MQPLVAAVLGSLARRQGSGCDRVRCDPRTRKRTMPRGSNHETRRVIGLYRLIQRRGYALKLDANSSARLIKADWLGLAPHCASQPDFPLPHGFSSFKAACEWDNANR